MTMLDDTYGHLWANDGRHVLVDLRGDRDPADFVIVEVDGPRVVLVDDDALAAEVTKRMVEAGVPIREDMPTT